MKEKTNMSNNKKMFSSLKVAIGYYHNQGYEVNVQNARYVEMVSHDGLITIEITPSGINSVIAESFTS